MIAQAREAVGRSALLSRLAPHEIEQLVALTSPWRAAAGETLFQQGDHADRLFVVTSGRLAASVKLATGDVRSLGELEGGALFGELALLARGPRMASVVALEDSEGVALSAEAFEFLRVQTKPAAHLAMRAIGEAALDRLHRVYELLLDDLGGGALPAFATSDGALVDADPVADAYLRQLLFFDRFEPGEAEALVGGLRVVAGQRGARLDCEDALWLVLRGAVELTLERDGARRRVRLAGPGRCVGHLAVRAEGAPDLPLRAVLRERAVLLEVPGDAGRAIMGGDEPAQRRFTEAFHEDVVRAVLAAETPQAAVVRHAH